jgi:hypothetical protein
MYVIGDNEDDYSGHCMATFVAAMDYIIWWPRHHSNDALNIALVYTLATATLVTAIRRGLENFFRTALDFGVYPTAHSHQYDGAKRLLQMKSTAWVASTCKSRAAASNCASL